MDGETEDNVWGERGARKQETTPHVISRCASHDVHAPPLPRDIYKKEEKDVGQDGRNMQKNGEMLTLPTRVRQHDQSHWQHR